MTAWTVTAARSPGRSWPSTPTGPRCTRGSGRSLACGSWQTGNQEMRAVFPPEALEAVAGVIRARRRAVRIMTAERLASLTAARQKAHGVYPRGVSRPQEPAEAAG